MRGDKTQLTQVLTNLVSNARDTIGAKAGTVWITLSRLEIDRSIPLTQVGTLHRRPYAVITVKDTGTGMDEPTLCKIVEPFCTTKAVGKSTRLGLSVSHGIPVSRAMDAKLTGSLGRMAVCAGFWRRRMLDYAGTETFA